MTTSPSSIHQAFENLPDPRAHNVTFPLIHLVFMALVGLVCGATTWTEIVEVCTHKTDILKEFIDFKGVPSHDTFERVFSRLDPNAFSDALTAWVLSTQKHLKSKHIAADGKSSRASASLPDASDMLHTTSLFLAQEGLFLAARGAHEKMHEVSDLKALLAPLDLKGALLTADALHTSTVTCELLTRKKADYVLPLKENCPSRFAEVEAEFDYRLKDKPASVRACVHVEKGHGRVEERLAWAIDVEASWFGNLKEWKGLRSVVRLERRRYLQAQDKEEREVRYFLSSLTTEHLEETVRAIRAHWSVENQGHWCLDMVLDDDRNRSRRGHSGKNMALLKRVSLNMLRQMKSGPDSLRRKQLVAAIKDSYLRRVLNSL